MSQRLQIAICAVLFGAFLVFQFGNFELSGLGLLAKAFIEIAGTFAAFWLVVMLMKSNKSKP
jgi:hypothetical protein